MLPYVLSAIAIVIGYLLGSIPTGYLVARMRGIDIQQIGSGNIGATNVLRTMGPLPALFVVLIDPLKGALAVLVAMLFQVGPWGVALTGLAAVLGNNFNVFLGLRGGKGVATSMGVFVVIAPYVTLLAIVIGVFTMALGRYVSLGSLVGIASASALLLAQISFPPPHLYLALTLLALAMIRHRANIRRLAAGTERRLGERGDGGSGGGSQGDAEAESDEEPRDVAARGAGRHDPANPTQGV